MRRVILLSSIVFVFALLAGCGRSEVSMDADVENSVVETGDVQEDVVVEGEDQNLSADLEGIVVLNADIDESAVYWSAKRVLY
jgi:hypothetical protein